MTTPYISWLGHGAADLAPPGVFTGATASCFGFQADQDAMQALADKLLNPANGGVVRYQAIGDMAMVSFMDIQRCTSGTDIVGWLPGRETALWIPLLESYIADPNQYRVVFWAPYIFINYAIGMVIGRQTWGWPKVMADITVPTDNPAAPVFDCTTTYFPTLSQSTQGVTGSLFRITGMPAGDVRGRRWTTPLQAFEAVADGLLGGLGEDLIKALGDGPQVPSVALKQFRQPGAATTTCYQAICDSPIELTAFSGGDVYPDGLSLEITTCESHQIVADFLGAAPSPGSTTVPVKFGGWIEIDFQALTGDVIVAA
ncbi:MAG TPA: hypothetical protein VG227_08230 [Caulobacteraceae bacterium]|nr:hypothetical protein [Caulobacteraceae bacterium]